MFEFGTTGLAQHLMLNRSGRQLRETVSRLTSELASGQVNDKARALKGALGQLAHVENAISMTDQHLVSANFAGTFLDAQQNVIGRLGKVSQDVALDLQLSKQSPSESILKEAGSRAADAFQHATGLLNTKIAGRYIFSGTAGDVRPFADPEAIMNALVSSLPPNASPAGIQTHVKNWFAVGGDFDLIAYQGQDATSTGLDLGDQNAVRFDITGSDPAIRDALAGLALGAIGGKLSPTITVTDRRELLSMSASLLFASDGARISLESSIGSKEAQVSEAKTRAEARGTALRIARNDLLASDPYEVATALEAATQKLDALYLVTARLSRLSLTEYLR